LRGLLRRWRLEPRTDRTTPHRHEFPVLGA
jgi:hypothetical protein